jgi:dTDP-4-amino-4,6-dideoxygalactose transaminase
MTQPETDRFIPAVRLDNAEVWTAIEPRLKELVLSGQFILGPLVEEFEAAAARTFGCPWAVGTASGMSALVLALRAAPLQAGSRVALPANTFFAVFEAVVLAGHIPIITDHDEDYLLSPELLEPLDVQAVVPVHLYGLPVDMGPLMAMAEDREWWVLEDASQAHGATVGGRPIGSFGHAAAFSAYPTKNLGAWGDAGFVTGSDPQLRDRIRALTHHGQREPNVHGDVGGTDRLDAMQAVVLTEKLGRLPMEVDARRRVASWYAEALDPLGLDLPGDRVDRLHAYHQFVVRVPRRDRVREHLAKAGIGTGIHYPTPIHLQPGARGRCEVPVTPKRAEAWAGELLSLPMFPGLTKDEVGRVAAGLRAALG